MARRATTTPQYVPGRGRSRGRLPTGQPNPVDVHVGNRVRLRRTLLGLSQEKLGEAIGLTFQQIQKYERGANRIGASRLWDLSRVLDVPISFFFEDIPEDAIKQSPRMIAPTGMKEDEASAYEADPLSKGETLELVRNYFKIHDPGVRKRVFDLTKTLATSAQDDEEAGAA